MSGVGLLTEVGGHKGINLATYIIPVINRDGSTFNVGDIGMFDTGDGTVAPQAESTTFRTGISGSSWNHIVTPTGLNGGHLLCGVVVDDPILDNTQGRIMLWGPEVSVLAQFGAAPPGQAVTPTIGKGFGGAPEGGTPAFNLRGLDGSPAALSRKIIAISRVASSASDQQLPVIFDGWRGFGTRAT